MDSIKNLFFNCNSNPLVQFFRYSLVGGAAAAVDISMFAFYANVMGVNPLMANTLSFIFGLTVNYFLSRGWVFNKKQHEFIKDFILFSIIGVIGLAFSNVILFLLLDTGLLYRTFYMVGNGTINLAAKLVAVFLVLFWNFVARKKIVFQTA